MRHIQPFLTVTVLLALSLSPVDAEAGWQGRRTKCVKPDSAITAEQQQSLSAAVSGGTVAWNAAGEVDQASASATTNVVLSQEAFNQAWIRYELCLALDNNRIDQAMYNRLMEQSLQSSMGTAGAPASVAPVAVAPVAVAPVAVAPVAVAPDTPPAAPVASSGTAWMDQIQAQTQLRSGSDYANMAAYGYTLLDVAKTALLAPSTAETVPLSLPSGYEYALMGVCDNDCSDLDLAIIKDGTELSRDTSTDDWPVLSVVPTSGSSYQVKVSMYQCTTATCGYQVTVWKGPETTSAPAPAAVAAPAAAATNTPVPLGSSTRLQGTLASGDYTLPNGEWSDHYTISVQAGQSISASMTSSDIDTYLVAQMPSGTSEGNDDCNGDRAQSCINITAQESGDWTIYATSYQADDSGTYDLQLEVR